ncbi:hypothetical protein HPB49_010795 [Dermacentor silvarum]|uniref:Uncharacterized protein n=1 Tax=Dermacentor silvarum TaxID=543639 RepID=A0ACB8D4N1_DERSI|nr:hypothetical protein HPB49_010795 [Dermacentor silvarum]
MLVAANLEDDVRTLVQDLKRGPTKLLSIAIATLGKPKVIVIDEPTSGLDRYNTQLVWNMLLRVRRSSALLISTHDMTEADVLADRVVSLTQGIVVCNASPTHLKSIYGVGYKVSLKKSTRAPFQKQQVLSILRRYVPSAELLHDEPEHATIGLHTVVSKDFDRMFRELERAGARLGIRSIGLTVSTLKDIYLKHVRFVARYAAADLAKLITIRGEKPGSWSAAVQVVMLERSLFLRRRWATYVLLSWLLSLLMLVAAFQWMNADMLEQEPAPATVMHVPVSVRDHYPHAATFLDDDAASGNVTHYYQRLASALHDEDVVVTVYKGNARDVLLSQAMLDYVAYTQHYVFGAVFRGDGLQAWFNPYAGLSRSLAVDLVSSAVLAFRAADPSARFKTTLAIHVPEV